MTNNDCPRCKHARINHIAGQCYEVGPGGWFHFCMTYLGAGNAWQAKEGWYDTEGLNIVAEGLPKGKRPFLRYL